MKAWYVARTKPRKERLVENYLSRQEDVDVFIPYIQRPSVKKSSLEMLFPSYIFCFVDPESKDWGAIRYAPGISYFLGNGREIIPVHDDIVTQIKCRVSAWNAGDLLSGYKTGDSIIINDGPFAGLDAIFQKYIPARQRCQILVEIMGQLNKAEIPVSNIGERPQNLRLAYAT